MLQAKPGRRAVSKFTKSGECLLAEPCYKSLKAEQTFGVAYFGEIAKVPLEPLPSYLSAAHSFLHPTLLSTLHPTEAQIALGAPAEPLRHNTDMAI